MKYSTQVKPISYLKAHASEVIRELGDKPEPMIITQNGEAKVVLQGVEYFEQTQDTLALLKLLALGQRQIEDGQVQQASEVIRRIRDRG